jgi:hypothetical protein
MRTAAWRCLIRGGKDNIHAQAIMCLLQFDEHIMKNALESSPPAETEIVPAGGVNFSE